MSCVLSPLRRLKPWQEMEFSYTTQPGAPGPTPTGFTQNTGSSAFIAGPMVDGTIIPIQPIVAWHTGAFNKPMTIMNGSTSGRSKTFSSAPTEMFETPRKPLTAAQYEAAINATYTAPPGSARCTLPCRDCCRDSGSLPGKRLSVRAIGLGCGRDRPEATASDAHIDNILGPQVPVYQYSFDDRTAPILFPTDARVRSLGLPYERPTISVPAAGVAAH